MALENFRSHVLPKVEEARGIIGSHLRITSGVRTKDQNAKLRGASKTSAHLDGMAADIVPVGISLRDAYNKLASNKNFMSNVDQLILEEENGCIHIGMSLQRQARQELREQINGRYVLTSDGAIRRAASEFGVSASLISKIMGIESGGNDNAKSYGRALGSMQFLESTWEGLRKKGLKVDPWQTGAIDRGQATRAAAFMLSGLVKKYGDDYLAYAAYGNGEALVDRARKIQKQNGGDFVQILAGLRYEAVLERRKGFTPSQETIDKRFGGSLQKAAEAGRKEVLTSAAKFGAKTPTTEAEPVRETVEPVFDFWDGFGTDRFDRAISLYNDATCKRIGEKFRGFLEQRKKVSRPDFSKVAKA